MSTVDAARILNVDVDIEATALKKYWRQISKKYHPDLHPNNQNAEVKFKKLNAAYTILINLHDEVRTIHGLEKEILDNEFERWIKYFSPEKQKRIRRELAELKMEDEQD